MKIGIVGDVHLTETVPKARTDLDYLNTLLGKLEFVYKQCDVVVFLGDLFDKPNMAIQGLNKIISFFFGKLVEKKKSFVVMGNHDIPHLNPDSIYKSNLGTLSIMRLVNIVATSIDIDGLVISSIPMSVPIECPKVGDASGTQILIGHCFYESSLDPSYSIDRFMVEESGYDYIFLGHDHEPHDTLRIGKTELYRIGALCRNTSHGYQLSRIPKFFLFDTERGALGLVDVPCCSGANVFREEVLKKPEENEFSFLLSPDALIDKFAQFKDEDNGITILSVLRSIANPAIIKYITDTYKGLDMVLK